MLQAISLIRYTGVRDIWQPAHRELKFIKNPLAHVLKIMGWLHKSLSYTTHNNIGIVNMEIELGLCSLLYIVTELK